MLIEKHINWISVKEGLPSKEEVTLVAVTNDACDNQVGMAKYEDGCWIDLFCDEIEGVTHWMPLPAKPNLPEKSNG